MDTIQEKRLDEQGLKLHFIQSKKFKTITFVAKIKAKLDKETITKRALLPYILKQGTKTYPDRSALQLKLDDLYGAVLTADGGKKGENHIITIRLEFANEKFIPDASNVMDEAIRLFSEVLFHPNAGKNGFDDAVFKREVGTLKQKINAIQDDKMSYANMRLIDEMCKEEAYQLHVHGYEEDLNSLMNEDLYNYYQQMLKQDEMDIYVLGDFVEEKVKHIIKDTMQRTVQQGTSTVNAVTKKPVSEQQEIIEKQQVQQAKLHIGYRTNTTYQDDAYFALQVFNGLFGGFPSSKLFINVREKNSLAYYASSRLESHKGLLFVFSGIAPDDFEKARDIIRLQVQAMKDGDFTEQELNETKDLIINQLKETMDHPQGLIEILYQQVIGKRLMTPTELLDGIQNVTKEEVVQVAGKVEEDTVYLLTSEGGEQGE
ncbi:EF-P 5-aminopentanol modification-associated protein YfmF [Oceanobacillus polygoni]|uniref:Zn-dependent peptidase n=1 Tax=Oceanobacillus polygoni TaxID=1235259 RepID=A0A9X0YS78_9BACI|nr:pitrilysin family protein [Oceanobacillus polygoni]MBP2077719.1 putative Zn-dependent peptidase [Oceanobacillus polygoni]